jgi:xylulokinase
VTVLTLDLGTSSTKAALWSGPELVELVRAPIPTEYPRPGLVEQQPEGWWQSVADACAALRDAAPSEYARLDTLGCSAARETFACFDSSLEPLSPGILWSDSRAGDQLAAFGDPAVFRLRTGVLLGEGCQAAKVAWVRQHEPSWFVRAAWILSPRDYVLARLTGEVRTEPTMASRTGWYELDGQFIGDRALAERLPAVVPSLRLFGVPSAGELALPSGVAAILGAGDRACEVVGVGATATEPMVSWGTTVNVSVPHEGPSDVPPAAQVSRGAASRYLAEAGLSAGGEALEWLATLTGSSSEALLNAAADVAPGADGVLAFPWLHGARAPWWHHGARAAFTGVTSAHGASHLARALIEGIAFDTARSAELLTDSVETLLLAGAGAESSLWRSILAAVTSASVTVRQHADAATAGARALATVARGTGPDLDALNPVRTIEQPRAELVETYRRVRGASDVTARALLEAPIASP